MYLVYTLVLLINIFGLFVNKKLKNRKNEFQKEKGNLIRYLIRKIINNINITLIILNITYYISTLLEKGNINIIDLILFIITILSYLLFCNNKNKVKELKFKFLNDYEYKHISIIIANTINIFAIAGRVGDVNNILSITLNIIIIGLIVNSFMCITNYLKSNKNNVVFNAKEENFLPDVKFYNKINISSFYYYIVYTILYILFGYVKLPYSLVIYILIIAVIVLTAKRKLNKIKKEEKHLYRQVTVARKIPGVVYAFDFYRDILLCKNLFIFSFILSLSVITIYICSSTVYIYTAIQLCILYIYILTKDKNQLIKNIGSLNKDFIDTNIYKINQVQKLSYIDNIKIKFLNIKLNFYKLIYIDLNNNVYESNLVLYDPELFIENINIYINPNNISDYIIILKDMYE